MHKFIVWTLFLINLAAILTFWWQGSSSFFSNGARGSAFIAFGRLFGLLAELFILVEFILISRAPFIEKAYGFDSLIMLHRRIGYALAGSIMLHPLFITIGYARAGGVSLVQQFLDFLTNWEHVVLAVIGLGMLLAVAVVSLPAIRRQFKYEIWHATHLLMYAAVALVFLHQIQTADVSFGLALYYWYTLNFSVFGTLIAYRLLHPFLLFRKHRFVVERVVSEPSNVHSVYITGKRMEEFTYHSGQYIHVSFLASGMWSPHPFSLSVAPNGKYIRISPKALGDFTSRIKDLKPGTKVILEGPLGRFTERAATKKKYLLIAGGIGITPIRALAESLMKQRKDAILIYGNRTPENIVFKEELQQLGIPSHHVLSMGEAPGYEHGYVDKEKIERLVPDFRDRDLYLCGPKPMMESIIKFLRSLGIPRQQIHYERFAY